MKSSKARLKKRSSQDVGETKSKSAGTKTKPRTRRSGPTEPTLARIFVTNDVDSTVSKVLGVSGFEVVPLDLEALQHALAQDGIPCAVLWDDPTNCLATAIMNNACLETTVEDYISRARDLILTFRQNRHKLTLVDAGLLSVARTDAAWALFCSRLNVQTDTLRIPTPLMQQVSVAQLLARLAVTELGSLKDILEELRASSVSPEPAGFSLKSLEIAATDHTRQAQALSEAQAEIQAIRSEITQLETTSEGVEEERDLLRTQVRLQTQEISRLTHAFDAETSAHHETARKADQDLSRALADLRDEAKKRRSLEKQKNRTDHDLSRALAKLEEETNKRRSFGRQNDRLMRRVGDLNSKLDKLLSSTSWRLTRPLRAIKLKVGKGDKPIDVLIAEERQRELDK